MTEENKKNILNYITNSIEQTEADETEIFKEIRELSRDKWSEILPQSYTSIRVEGMISPSENTSGLTVLYGGYYQTNLTQANGFIILVNDKWEPVKVFYNYDNGTPLRYIQRLNQAEDGTFYGIDDTYYTYEYIDHAFSSLPQNTVRFVMFNNFTMLNTNTNNYSLSLRTSYIFADSNFYCLKIDKDLNSATYAMAGVYLTSYNNNYFADNSKIITLKINVGSSNEWITEALIDVNYFGCNFEFGDNVKYNLMFFPSSNSQTSLYIRSGIVNDTKSDKLISNFPYPSYFRKSMQNQIVFSDNDTIYFVGNNQFISFATAQNVNIGLYKYKISTQQLTAIFEKNYGLSTSIWDSAIYLEVNRGSVYIQYNNNYTSGVYLNSKADYYFQRLQNDVWDPILINNQKNFRHNSRGLFINNSFNLLKIDLFSLGFQSYWWYSVSIKENFNPFNYNGEPYTDYNSVLPQQVEVYHNNSLVFARNLYNKTINENQTNSTVVMPNTYLNNIDLVPQILLSQTNSQMVINNNPITKNIYETLYMNFINTINVINEDTGAIYPRTASYINQNINVGTQDNCESSSVGKVRINANNGSAIETITWNDIDDTHKQTEFALQVNDTINSIELISNDELTTYVTIDTSELETGKTYNISQKLRID